MEVFLKSLLGNDLIKFIACYTLSMIYVNDTEENVVCLVNNIGR